jgi:hypothetical protein
MPHADRRKLFERAAFERYCDAREIEILDGTFEQPPDPAPDIRVTIIGEGPVAFELVCLDDDAGQERLNLMSDSRALTRHYHLEMAPVLRAAFDTAFGDAIMMIAFVSTSGKRGVRKALPGLFEMLMQLPLRATGHHRIPADGIEYVHIARDRSIQGPEFTTSSSGFVGSLNLAKLEEKLGNSYESDAPNELLAYAAEISRASDDDKIPEILNRLDAELYISARSGFRAVAEARDVLSPPGVMPVPKPKIKKVERLVNEQMLAMLEWAADHPPKWHNIGKLEATKRAAELLEKRGVIEIWRETNLYTLKQVKPA